MRQVTLPGTDLQASCLGMGCASLGSRYGAAAGLRRLQEAFDLGVSWFDTAPAYGAGEAETILGQFLKARRDRVNICTKVGLAPPRQSALKRMAYPLLRPLAARVAGLRRAIRGSGATRNVHLPLTPALIEDSIGRSLQHLGTDHVDVFALHDPSLEDIGRDEVLAALQAVLARGQARFVAVAGELPVDLAAAAGGAFPVIQLKDDPAEGALDQVRAAAGRPIAAVTHSVLGVGGARDAVAGRLAADPALAAQAAAAGFSGPPAQAAADLLLARAFASNPDGVVLLSGFGPGHLEANAAAASRPLQPAALGLVRAMFSGASAAEPAAAAP